MQAPLIVITADRETWISTCKHLQLVIQNFLLIYFVSLNLRAVTLSPHVMLGLQFEYNSDEYAMTIP